MPNANSNRIGITSKSYTHTDNWTITRLHYRSYVGAEIAGFAKHALKSWGTSFGRAEGIFALNL